MSIEDREDLLMILGILRTKNRGEPAKRYARANDDKQYTDAKRDRRINPPLPCDPDCNEAREDRKCRPKVREQVLAITDKRSGTGRTPNAQKREARDAVQHRARGDEREPEIQARDLDISSINALSAVRENHESRHRNQHPFEERTDKLNRSVTVRMFLIRWTFGIDEREECTKRRHDVHDALECIAEDRIRACCEPTREFQAESDDSYNDRPTRRRAGAS